MATVQLDLIDACHETEIERLKAENAKLKKDVAVWKDWTAETTMALARVFPYVVPKSVSTYAHLGINYEDAVRNGQKIFSAIVPFCANFKPDNYYTEYIPKWALRLLDRR